MIMLEVSPEGEILEKGFELEDTVSGTVGLAGTHKGILAIHFPSAVACGVTANFLGMAADEVADDVDDAVGEIANMLGGSIKAFLTDNGRDINLSLPSIIRGSKYTFNAKGSVERMFIPFKSEVGVFYVEFQLENS